MINSRSILAAFVAVAVLGACSNGSSADRTDAANPPQTRPAAGDSAEAPIDLEQIPDAEVARAVPVDLPGPLVNLRTSTSGAVYVREDGTSRLHRIDPSDGSVAASTEVPGGTDDDGRFFYGVAAGSVWATNPASGVLHKLDPETLEIVAEVELPATPAGNYWTHETEQLVVNGYGDDEAVWIVDTGDDRVGPRLGVPKADDSVPGFGRIWVGNIERGTVTALDPENGDTIATVDVGPEPGQIGVTEDAVWVSDRRDGTVTRIDPDSARVTGSEEMVPGVSNYTVGAVFEVEGAAFVLVFAGTADRGIGGIAALDPTTAAVTGRRLLPGAPGGLQRLASMVLALVSDAETGESQLLEIDPATLVGD